jgi:hypothetical protein
MSILLKIFRNMHIASRNMHIAIESIASNIHCIVIVAFWVEHSITGSGSRGYVCQY